MESFEHKGVWWLPEEPENKVGGILKFDPLKFPRLELLGSFNKKLAFPINSPIILGVISEKAKPVTLSDCLEVKRPSSFSSSHSFPQTYSTFSGHTIFLGYHFAKEDEILFKSMAINYLNLEEWSRSSGKHWKVRASDESSGIQIIPHPEEITAQIDNTAISIRHQFSENNSLREYKVKQTTFVYIKPSEVLHFNIYRKDIFHRIGVFLSLAMGRATYPVSIEGKVEAAPMPIDVYVPLVRDMLETSKKIYQHNMFLTLENISDDFEKCLSNWFSKSSKLEPIYNLYSATLNNPSMYEEQKFLVLSQAIEAYHGRMRNKRHLSDTQYTVIYDHLISQIPTEVTKKMRERIESSLKYANRFSLRNKLTDLWKEHQKLIKYLIPNRDKFDRFANSVTGTRNFLTHYDEDGADKAKTDLNDLYKLSIHLRFLLEICLLSELELPLAAIEAIIERSSSKYKQYLDAVS